VSGEGEAMSEEAEQCKL